MSARRDDATSRPTRSSSCSRDQRQIEFADDSPTLHIGVGDVVRLAPGAQTVWTVTETLRKVYLTRE